MTVYYKQVQGNEGDKCNYPIRLDSYGCGCQHNCKYCYAKSLLSFRGLWNPLEPKCSDVEEIEKVVEKIPKGTVVRLGGMTDCFMPIEKEKRITYNAIKSLNEHGIEYLIVTKSAIVADDEYMELMDKKLCHIQITVTTLDNELCQMYESASAPDERIKAILKLQNAGFDVAIRLSPFIPEFIDTKRLSRTGINKAVVEFLRVNGWIKRWFKIDYSKYTKYSGGYYHLPLARKIRYIESVKGFKEITVCEDCDDDYLYWKQYFNPNKEDCCNLRRVNND